MRSVRAGDDLQAALNAARPGDELRLAPQATFSGNFVLPVTWGTSAITIRTDLPEASLPGLRQRVTPAMAAQFARIVSPNNAAALRTAPGAHHWRVMFVEFQANRDGYGDIIQLGDGSDAQTTLEQVPYEIVFDRVYIHGDPAFGQKRGISLNARAVTIKNCYISDIKAVGMDAQAIAGWNGPGQYTIENNYLEASGEVFLLGGADPAIPNLVPDDVTFRHNHVTRPMSWRDAAVPAPTGLSAMATDRGSLPAGVYAYRVVAVRPSGQGISGTSMPSSEVTAVASSGAVTVSWSAVAGATSYRVYARNPAGATQYFTVSTNSFLHNGATTGQSGTPPTSATQWQVKNLFELKNARRVVVQYNLFENNWQAAQPGYAILFTPRSQAGSCPWCIVEQVTFSDNVIRNVAGGFNITGYDNTGASGLTNRIVIQDNLLYGITTQLGGSGWPFLIGDEPKDVYINQNTIDFDGTTLLYAYSSGSTVRPMLGFRYTNNASPHGQYGVNGGGASTGTLTFQMYFPGVVFTGNWLSGGSSSRYPSGNRFEVPFDSKINGGYSAASVNDGTGAYVDKLLPLLDTVTRGFLTIPPQSPKGLRIISSGR